MAYIAWVRYGTSSSGYDDYLGLSCDGEDFVLVNDILRPAIRFNTLDDMSGDYYSRQVVNQQSVPYKLGLYSSDYYYRAEMYQASAEDQNIDAYDAIERYYKDEPYHNFYIGEIIGVYEQ